MDDFKVRNASELSKFVRDRPHEAEAIVEEWSQIAGKHHEVQGFKNAEQWESWRREHPELNIDSAVWVGNEIQHTHVATSESVSEIERLHEQHSFALPTELGSLATLPFMRNNDGVLESDKYYVKLGNLLENDWMKEHPGMNFSSDEWIKHRYGDLDSSEPSEFEERLETRFKQEHEKRFKAYQDPLKRGKIQRIQDFDQAVQNTRDYIRQQQMYRYQAWEKLHPNERWQNIEEQIEVQGWMKFARQYPEKAKAYADNNPQLKRALERMRLNEMNLSKQVGGKQEDKKDDDKSQSSQQQLSEKDVQQQQQRLQKLINRLKQLQKQPVEVVSTRPSNVETGGGPSRPPSQPGQGASSRVSNLAGRAQQSAGRAAGKLGGQAGKAVTQTVIRLLASTSEVWGTILLIVAVVVHLVILFIILFGPNGNNGGGFCSGDVGGCSFYGSNGQGIKAGNPAVSAFVVDTANKVGVPASIVAGILRIESPTFFASTDPNAFSNDFDNHPSSVNCCFGVGQFSPATFLSTFNGDRDLLRNQFNKSDVDPHPDTTTGFDYNDPSNANFKDKTQDKLRIYSVRDSIIAIAVHVRQLKRGVNADGPWNEDTVRKIGSLYQGSCANHYCDDLWASFNSCQAAGIPSSGAGPLGFTLTCPLDPVANTDFKIVCGTFDNPDPVTGCGHGILGPPSNYPACTHPPYESCGPNGTHSEALKKSIDVVEKSAVYSDLAPVMMPFINGNQLAVWTLVGSPIALTVNTTGDIGYRYDYQTTFNGKTILIKLEHLNPPAAGHSAPAQLNSGAQLGTLAPANRAASFAAHLHIDVVVDGTPVEPEKQAFICSTAIPPTPTPTAGGKTVVLDPGHALNVNQGAPGEAENALTLAQLIRDRLTGQGYKVFLTRESNTVDASRASKYPDYRARVSISNSNNADLFVAIHFDATSTEINNGGPFSIYSNRKIISDNGVDTRDNTNIVTPNVDDWIANSRKANHFITARIANTLASVLGATINPSVEYADHACLAGACGGHIYVIGPQGTLSNPGRDDSIITEENHAVSAYVETMSIRYHRNLITNDLLNKLADAYVNGINDYFGTSENPGGTGGGGSSGLPGATTGGSCSNPPPGTPPPSVEDAQLLQTLHDQFGITMIGAWDTKHLRWIYENFWKFKVTKFTTLINGEAIHLITCGAGSGPNQIKGYVEMCQNGAYDTNEHLFITILTHELGHDIYWHRPVTESFRPDMDNLFRTIGGVTSYGATDITENYPETITYCLNGAAVGTIRQGPWPQYKDTAVKILGSCFY